MAILMNVTPGTDTMYIIAELCHNAEKQAFTLCLEYQRVLSSILYLLPLVYRLF